MEEKISKEMAQQELERFLLKARIKKDAPRSQEMEEKFLNNCDNFIYEVMRGGITVDEEGWPAVHTESDFLSQITWSRRPNGTDRCASLDKNQGVSAQYAWVGSVTGKPPGALRKLDDADWEVVWLVHELFLGNRT